MTKYCQEGQTAFVRINTPPSKEEFSIDLAPIYVDIAASDIKCWRFQGFTNNIVIFEHFACGKTAYFQSSSGLQNNGAWLVVDGVIQNGENYFYWSGTFSGTTYSRSVQEVSAIQRQGSSSGNCPCLEQKFKLTIKNKNNAQVYEKYFKDSPDVQVSCDGCPPGHLRLNSPSYPGYCCIPCSEVVGGIKSITAAVRRINRG